MRTRVSLGKIHFAFVLASDAACMPHTLVLFRVWARGVEVGEAAVHAIQRLFYFLLGKPHAHPQRTSPVPCVHMQTHPRMRTRIGLKHQPRLLAKQAGPRERAIAHEGI